MIRLKSMCLGMMLVAALATIWIDGANAQANYGKVSQVWSQQGKISGGIAVGSSSAATLLPSAGQIAWICNTGSVDAYLAFGATNAVVAASTTSSWLKNGTCAAYDLFPFTILNRYVASIAATSTTLTVETGIGTPPAQGGSGGGGIAGNVSNASSAVSPTSTNIGSASYNYIWNGSAWDQAGGLIPGTAGTPSTQVITGQDIVGMIKLSPVGTSAFAATQVSVGTSATLLAAARTGAQGTGRKTVCVTQVGTTVVYLGGSGVTTSTGDYLAGAAGTGKCWDTQAALYGIVGSGTQTVSVTETY